MIICLSYAERIFGMGQALNGNDTRNPDFFMKEALKEAEKAFRMGDVPVGAIIEIDGEIVGRGHNRTEKDKDPTAHAEIIAIREASKTLDRWRLTGCTLYVTTEPCPMCAGAIVLSRVDRLVIGTMDSKTGACGSLYDIPRDSRLNHFVPIDTGVLEEECSLIMKNFFKVLRSRKQDIKNKPGG